MYVSPHADYLGKLMYKETVGNITKQLLSTVILGGRCCLLRGIRGIHPTLSLVSFCCPTPRLHADRPLHMLLTSGTVTPW